VYLKGWLEALKGDAHLIVTAASTAQRAADSILGRDRHEATRETATSG
jgi:antirestriction protein ArdC